MAMYKREMLEKVRQDAKVWANLEAIDAILKAFCKLIRDETLTHGWVRVNGLGVFSLRRRDVKLARNLWTGERLKLPPRMVVHFRPSNSFNRDAATVRCE